MKDTYWVKIEFIPGESIKDKDKRIYDLLKQDVFKDRDFKIKKIVFMKNDYKQLMDQLILVSQYFMVTVENEN